MVNPITPSDLVRSVHLAASSNGVCIIGHNNTVYIVLVSTGFSIALPLSYVVRAVAVNPSGTAVAFGGDGKFVEIADLEHSNGALRIVKRHQTESVTKRIINVSFETDESLLVGDKFGEIFRCSAANGYALAQSSRSILAHLGMITALTTSVAVDSLVTADRDGNVRVSSHKLPDEIRGFLWIPLADARRLNSKDAVTCSLAWVTPHVLATGTLDGIVCQWDLSRASIDQSDALVEAPVKYDSPVVGFVKRGSVTRAAVDGDLFLRGLGEANDTKTVAVPSPVVAAADRVMLHRDGTLSQLTDDDLVVAISGFRVDSADLGTLDVKALWHTREAKNLGGAQDDADGEGEADGEDELEPSAKRAPRAEETTAAL